MNEFFEKRVRNIVWAIRSARELDSPLVAFFERTAMQWIHAPMTGNDAATEANADIADGFIQDEVKDQ